MLTETAIKGIKPADKPKKYFDERGLYLLVQPNGSRWWRLKYQHDRKEKTISLGVYPEVGLKKARDRRDEARKLVADGIDPSAKRQSERDIAANTFQAVALELFTVLRKSSIDGESSGAAGEVVQRAIQPHRKRRARKREPISADTIDTMERRLQMHVFPDIGSTDIGKVTSADLLVVLRRIEDRGTFELARRVRSICSRVFRFAKATGRAAEDVAADLIGLLTPVEPEHMATIVELQKIAMLLRASDTYRGDRITQLALKLAPLLFPRPIEFRTMEWEHITLDGPTPEWRVPWRRMKMRDPHIVPLSRQAAQILLDLKRITGDGRYVFPHPRTDQRPRSENWITAALRSMGFSGEEMSWHGYRALASTQLNELGWNDKWIETQLAHVERNKVKGAYNHAKYLQQRRAMMQAWGDFLDELRADKDGAAIDRAGTKAEAAARDTEHLPNAYEKFRRDLAVEPAAKVPSVPSTSE